MGSSIMTAPRKWTWKNQNICISHVDRPSYNKLQCIVLTVLIKLNQLRDPRDSLQENLARNLVQLVDRPRFFRGRMLKIEQR